MTQWEEEIVKRYGSLKNYVYGCLSSEKPNAIKARFDQFYREMEMAVNEGKDRDDAWMAVSECYNIQMDTLDDYVLDAVLYSFKPNSCPTAYTGRRGQDHIRRDRRIFREQNNYSRK